MVPRKWRAALTPRKPARMNLPPPPQQKQTRSAQKTQARAGERADTPPPLQRHAEEQIVVQAQARSEGITLAAAKSTAGRNGERNLKVQWLDVWVGGNKPCRFVVTTTTGNTLEATLEQISYKKVYRAGAMLQTDIVPIAPIGTCGSLLVTDTTTGEMLEQPWTWNSLGGGSQRQSLWERIKKLFT
jgi:hypothetical protein